MADKTVDEVQFLLEAYKKNPDKENFYQRVCNLYSNGDIGERAYAAIRVLLGKNEKAIKKQEKTKEQLLKEAKELKKIFNVHSHKNSSSCGSNTGCGAVHSSSFQDSGRNAC